MSFKESVCLTFVVLFLFLFLFLIKVIKNFLLKTRCFINNMVQHSDIQYRLLHLILLGLEDISCVSSVNGLRYKNELVRMLTI